MCAAGGGVSGDRCPEPNGLGPEQRSEDFGELRDRGAVRLGPHVEGDDGPRVFVVSLEPAMALETGWDSHQVRRIRAREPEDPNDKYTRSTSRLLACIQNSNSGLA